MQFDSRSDAAYYLKMHAPEFRTKLKVVKFRHTRLNDAGTEWEYSTKYTVVMK